MDLIHDTLKSLIRNLSRNNTISKGLLSFSPNDTSLDFFSHLKNIRSFLRVEKTIRNSSSSGSCGTSTSMDQSLKSARKVIIDNKADIRNIYTSGTKICHNQKLILSRPKIIQMIPSLFLVHF